MALIILFVIYMCFVGITSKVTPAIRLNTGKQMPVIGLGTWQTEGREVVDAVRDAIEVGYRHIDTAWFYHNEREVGRGIQEAFEKGIVQRGDIFITTKVWPRNMNRRKSLDIIKNSLKLLNTSYIDLVLMHFPLSSSRATAQVYKGLEDALNQNMAQAIGVSNFKPTEIKSLINLTKVKPAVNQIRIHPGFNQDDTINFCNKNNITVTGYSPLGTGSLVRNPILNEIGTKYNKTGAQVAIRWQIERGLIVIPKSVHKNRIIENFNVFDFNLTEDQIKRINSMPQKDIRDFWG